MHNVALRYIKLNIFCIWMKTMYKFGANNFSFCPEPDLPLCLLSFYNFIFQMVGTLKNNTLVSRYRGVQLHSDKFYFISSPIGETALSLLPSREFYFSLYSTGQYNGNWTRTQSNSGLNTQHHRHWATSVRGKVVVFLDDNWWWTLATCIEH